MSETQHTPGPWEADTRLNRTLPLGRDSAYGVWKGGVLIADIAGRPKSRRNEEDANARLIAAAPELLHALSQLLAWKFEPWAGDDSPEEEVVIYEAEAAIAAAKEVSN